MKLYIFLVILSFMFCFPALASEFYFSGNNTIGLNQKTEITLFLNTENEEINAVEGSVVVDSDNARISEVNNGNSNINFWIKNPKLENNEIKFAGLIPGGLKTGKANILSFSLIGQKEGVVNISAVNLKSLLNDGQGTESSLKITNYKLQITKNSTTTDSESVKDIYPPENFQVVIAQNQHVYDNQYFLVFSTTDKNSGIDYYEVSEDGKEFYKAVSPYLLKNQKLGQKIVVRVFDRAGNKREVVVDKGNIAASSFNIKFVILLVVLVLVVFFKRKRIFK